MEVVFVVVFMVAVIVTGELTKWYIAPYIIRN